jgi:hypothetical protein
MKCRFLYHDEILDQGAEAADLWALPRNLNENSNRVQSGVSVFIKRSSFKMLREGSQPYQIKIKD